MSVAASVSDRLSLRSNLTREIGPPYLSRVRSGQLVDEMGRVGNLGIRECFATPIHDLLTRDDRTLNWDDAGTDGFTEKRVGYSHHRNLLYRRMGLDSSLDFPGVHVETSLNDNVLLTAYQMQVALLRPAGPRSPVRKYPSGSNAAAVSFGCL